MTSDPKVKVEKLWDFCDVLRDESLEDIPAIRH